MSDLEIRAARDDELEAHGRLREHGYAFMPPHGDHFAAQLRAAGLADWVLGASLDGELVGTTTVYPLAQWFGGRPVPMGGVGSVVVAAERRGNGVCSALLGAALYRMRDGGLVISTLGPATVGVYRRAGWELAVDSHWRSVPLSALTALPSGVGVERPARDGDRGAIEAIHAHRSALGAGAVDRSDMQWTALLTPHPARSCYVVDDGGEVRGYIVYSRRRRDRGGYALVVHDIAALDWDAERTLWSHLGAHRMQTDAAVVHGVPLDGLAMHLGEQVISTVHAHQWMLRLVDVAGAVAARGYSPAVQAVVDLMLDDPVVAANRGPVRLVVADGVGRVEPGGSGGCEISVGPLSALWTGSVSARVLAATGFLRGATAADLAALDAVFAGPRPALNDDF